ncbi:uncharacterized protein LOC120207421 [Hibiscus syriacus]|uniref:uncharacterized protein LOC120207421 n=1 Tax=Hibiscus syriacus TaxID=106335 RepID=UPI001921CD06|nr:uncharacterized protein LOC120207421 [Hibiscus syriacus]
MHFDLVGMPVWIQLYNVLLELFLKKELSYIASAIGKPLHMDSITSTRETLEYVRVYVEIFACSKIPDHIDVLLCDESVARIKVIVPWMPNSCIDCGRFGHLEKYCPQRKKVEQIWRDKGYVHEVKQVVSATSNEAVKDVSTGNVNGGSISAATNSNAVTEQIDKENVSTVNVNGGSISATTNSNVVSDGIYPGKEKVCYDKVDVQVTKQIDQERAITLNSEQGSNPPIKRYRGRLAKEGGKTVGGNSKNKFEILNSIDPESLVGVSTEDSGRKQRGVSLGVAKIVQDLKLKNKEHVEKVKKLEDRAPVAGNPAQVFFQKLKRLKRCLKELIRARFSDISGQGDADALCKEVFDDEINEAIWGQGNNKSPGPDGYNPYFFKRS